MKIVISSVNRMCARILTVNYHRVYSGISMKFNERCPTVAYAVVTFKRISQLIEMTQPCVTFRYKNSAGALFSYPSIMFGYKVMHN